MIVRVTFDRPVPGLVTRDDPHGATFSREDGYIILDAGLWIHIRHETAPGMRLVPQSRVVYAECEDEKPATVDGALPPAQDVPGGRAIVAAAFAERDRRTAQTEKAKGKR